MGAAGWIWAVDPAFCPNGFGRSNLGLGPPATRDTARAMAQEHATTLRAMFAQWERGNLEPGTELFAPDIRFSAAQPEGQVKARGPQEIDRFMREFLAGWDNYRIELHELEDRGEGSFVAVATQHGTGKGSGVETTAPAFIAITFRNEQIAQLEFFLDRRSALEALEAAGLSE